MDRSFHTKALVALMVALSTTGAAQASNVAYPDATHRIEMDVREPGEYSVNVQYEIGSDKALLTKAASALGVFHKDASGKYIEATGIPAAFTILIAKVPSNETVLYTSLMRPASHSIAGGRYAPIATLQLNPGRYSATVSIISTTPELMDLKLKTRLTFGKSHHGK